MTRDNFSFLNEKAVSRKGGQEPRLAGKDVRRGVDQQDKVLGCGTWVGGESSGVKKKGPHG